MNRDQRRAAAAKERAGIPPVRRIKVLRVVPQNRNVLELTMEMSPAGILSFCGKQKLSQAIIGRALGAEILLCADDAAPDALRATREATWRVQNAQGLWGPVLHGIGAVVGLLPIHKKAISVPVGATWLMERIQWDPGEEA